MAASPMMAVVFRIFARYCFNTVPRIKAVIAMKRTGMAIRSPRWKTWKRACSNWSERKLSRPKRLNRATVPAKNAPSKAVPFWVQTSFKPFRYSMVDWAFFFIVWFFDQKPDNGGNGKGQDAVDKEGNVPGDEGDCCASQGADDLTEAIGGFQEAQGLGPLFALDQVAHQGHGQLVGATGADAL